MVFRIKAMDRHADKSARDDREKRRKDNARRSIK